MRGRHFVCKKKRSNKQGQQTHVDYICERSKCSAKFTVRRRNESDAWLAPLSVEHQVGTTTHVCTLTKSSLIAILGRVRE
jgi:hypothetical protein